MKNIKNHTGNSFKQVVAQSIRGFNGNILDSSMSDEVEREVKDEWEVVDEGRVAK